MTIGERLAAATVALTLFIAITGCISVGNGNGHSAVPAEGEKSSIKTVQVSLYPDGHLYMGNFYVAPDQIPTLAKEVAGSTVELTPMTEHEGESVSLEQALRVRDELLKHGVGRVVLQTGQ